MAKTSRVYQLIENLLDSPLDEHVRALRADGASWHTASVDISERTGVTVTPETLRIWLANEPDMERGRAGAA